MSWPSMSPWRGVDGPGGAGISAAGSRPRRVPLGWWPPLGSIRAIGSNGVIPHERGPPENREHSSLGILASTQFARKWWTNQAQLS